MTCKMTLCDTCTNIDYAGHCALQPWLMPQVRKDDAPKECRLWRGRADDILLTLNHRLELIEENEKLREHTTRLEAHIASLMRQETA